MANHIRQQIREALGTQLTGLATTGANVFQTRIYPIEDDELPCLTISNESEENEYLNLNIPRTVQRFITISVVMSKYSMKGCTYPRLSFIKPIMDV